MWPCLQLASCSSSMHIVPLHADSHGRVAVPRCTLLPAFHERSSERAATHRPHSRLDQPTFLMASGYNQVQCCSVHGHLR